MRYWKQFPPTHLLVRAVAIWAGAYKPEETQAVKVSSPDELRALFPSGSI
jgi:hypothetical protein